MAVVLYGGFVTQAMASSPAGAVDANLPAQVIANLAEHGACIAKFDRLFARVDSAHGTGFGQLELLLQVAPGLIFAVFG